MKNTLTITGQNKEITIGITPYKTGYKYQIGKQNILSSLEAAYLLNRLIDKGYKLKGEGL